jgi:hypothetical protein
MIAIEATMKVIFASTLHLTLSADQMLGLRRGKDSFGTASRQRRYCRKGIAFYGFICQLAYIFGRLRGSRAKISKDAGMNDVVQNVSCG